MGVAERGTKGNARVGERAGAQKGKLRRKGRDMGESGDRGQGLGTHHCRGRCPAESSSRWRPQFPSSSHTGCPGC